MDRLDRIVATQQQGLQQTREAVSSIQAETLTLRRDLTALSNDITAFVKEWQASRKTNWQFLTPIGGLMTAVITAATIYISSQVTTAIMPLSQEISAMRATTTATVAAVRDIEVANAKSVQEEMIVSTSTAAMQQQIRSMDEEIRHLREATASSSESDANSRTDRAHLNVAVDHNADGVSRLQAEVATLRASISTRLIEIETQFKGVSDISNLRTAYQERMNAMLYETINKGRSYPTTHFFPPSSFAAAPPNATLDK